MPARACSEVGATYQSIARQLALQVFQAKPDIHGRIRIPEIKVFDFFTYISLYPQVSIPVE